MAIPTNHKHILRFMFPNAEPDAWIVYDSPAGLAFRYWDATKAGGPEPTEQEMINTAASQAFIDYITVPREVSNYQLRRALNSNPQDRAAVNALINSSNDDNLKDGWTNSGSFKIDHPILQGAINNLGWTQQKVNDLFILASTFE